MKDLTRVPPIPFNVLPKCECCTNYCGDLTENLGGGVSGFSEECSLHTEHIVTKSTIGCIDHTDLDQDEHSEHLAAAQVGSPEMEHIHSSMLLQPLVTIIGTLKIQRLTDALHEYAFQQSMQEILQGVALVVTDSLRESIAPYVDRVCKHYEMRMFNYVVRALNNIREELLDVQDNVQVQEPEAGGD